MKREMPTAIDYSMEGYVHSSEAGSAVDGPGLRYLVFLAGCSYRCLYCHNPDTWTVQAAERKSITELIGEIKPYAPWLKRPGGITLSGGEPLQQPRFVEHLLWAVKEELSLHTAIETQGYLATRLPDSWFEPLDLVLMDLKHIDDQAHRALTGGFSVEPSLQTARRLAKMGKEMWIRHVIVPGYTDDPAMIARMAQFVATLPTVTRVELLPFHQLGQDKWQTLGLPYSLRDTRPPAPERMEQLRELFRAQGLETY